MASFDVQRLTYPESLPITERRAEIVQTIREHQVVIVAGETGSGKSTQLPKLCLEAGRGDGRLIGHTQPRRVAARTVAERIADELGAPLGTDVGYTVRFTDTVSEATVIKVMTDGILLAEIQRDRMLRRYDTLIIDEAHERSLNIDFILGYLAQLLPERPDLKLIVTSATIDTDRFAHHFASGSSLTAGLVTPAPVIPAPVITVTGRTYPVEVRYRPPDDVDQVEAVIDAVDELSSEGPGDVLVFLSGEREIHDTADALRRVAGSPGERATLEVLPLYARLSSAEQHRIFEPRPASSARRVVLATNVAETSVTVPGVRFVVDTGVARISRYSKRLKVQRLPIEPISQASANQRAGRCGRVAAGICIRLYTQDDFDERPEFTEPEILRTNLASVILQMTAIGLGDVANFPFVEPPDRASIRDGYALLEELAAIRMNDDAPIRELTTIGRRLARLPIDPRLARMVLESERNGCSREVLVIASGLSIQDPRERPQEQRDKANEFHNRFRVAGSDLLSMVALWDHLRGAQRELSRNQFRRKCRTEFLNYLRVREWMDLYSQLRRVAGELGIRPATHTATGDATHPDATHPDAVHKALLAGLLSHVGMHDRERRDFVGARHARFVIAPGSVLTRRPPEWVMAAELVETNQLYARRVAAIKPQWIEHAGAHLVKRAYGEARWDERGGRAVTTETVTLYGLTVANERVIGLDRIDPAGARAWFITKALVENAAAPQWQQRQAFLARNETFLAGVRRLADRVRRVEIVDDEMLFDFYDQRVGNAVTSTQHFDRWWKQERRNEPAGADAHRLDLTDEFVTDSLHLDGFPDVWHQRGPHGDVELPLTYRYAPGEPLDGVTLHVPLAALNQVTSDGFDWNVDGHRDELAAILIRSLPKTIRRDLIPLNDTLATSLDRLAARPRAAGERLVDALADVVSTVAGTSIAPTDFDATSIPDHLRLHIVISDDDGEVRAVGNDLAVIRAQLAGSVRASIALAAPIEERRGITDWDLGDLPQVVETTDRAFDVRAYPALLDVGDSVALRVVTTPELQRRVMHGGVRRLLIINAAPSRSAVERLLSNRDRLAIPSEMHLVDDCTAAAVDEVMRTHGSVPWTRAEFDELRGEVKRAVPGLAAAAMGRAVAVIAQATEARGRLARLHAEALRTSVDDANAHLGRLVRPGFVSASGIDRLDDLERYVRAINHRLDQLAGGVERDRRRMAEVVPVEQRYARIVDSLGPGQGSAELVDVAWQLEELRVATFAQQLVTRRPGAGSVSAKRITSTLDRLDRLPRL